MNEVKAVGWVPCKLKYLKFELIKNNLNPVVDIYLNESIDSNPKSQKRMICCHSRVDMSDRNYQTSPGYLNNLIVGDSCEDGFDGFFFLYDQKRISENDGLNNFQGELEDFFKSSSKLTQDSWSDFKEKVFSQLIPSDSNHIYMVEFKLDKNGIVELKYLPTEGEQESDNNKARDSARTAIISSYIAIKDVTHLHRKHAPKDDCIVDPVFFNDCKADAVFELADEFLRKVSNSNEIKDLSNKPLYDNILIYSTSLIEHIKDSEYVTDDRKDKVRDLEHNLKILKDTHHMCVDHYHNESIIRSQIIGAFYNQLIASLTLVAILFALVAIFLNKFDIPSDSLTSQMMSLTISHFDTFIVILIAVFAAIFFNREYKLSKVSGSRIYLVNSFYEGLQNWIYLRLSYSALNKKIASTNLRVAYFLLFLLFFIGFVIIYCINRIFNQF